MCNPWSHRDPDGLVSFLCLFSAGGQSHIAVDCPTKRAAVVADIRKGRLLDVPAWLWCLQAVTLIFSKALTSLADMSARRHLVDP